MNKIKFLGPDKEHLFSLECEDGSIGIENPEVLPVVWLQPSDEDGYYVLNQCSIISKGYTFPLPDDIEWKVIEVPETNSGIDGSGPTYSKVDFKKLVRLKLKSLPEKGAGDDYPVIEQNQDDLWKEFQRNTKEMSKTKEEIYKIKSGLVQRGFVK